MTSKKLIGLFSIVLTLLFVVGCDKESDDVPSGNPISVSERIGTGWELYRQGSYAASLEAFLDASSRDATSLEAYLGIGWASYQVGQLDQALGNLDNVIALAGLPDLGLSPAMIDTLTAEALAGKSSVNLVSGDYTSAYSGARSILAIMPAFRFRYDHTIDWRRISLLEAEAAYSLNQFSAALAAVTRLDSTLYNDRGLLERITRPVSVTLLGATTVTTGKVQLDIPDPFLVTVREVADTTRLVSGNFVTLPVDSLAEGGSTIWVIATPTPSAGSQYRVQYLRTNNYAEFLRRLRTQMVSLR